MTARASEGWRWSGGGALLLVALLAGCGDFTGPEDASAVIEGTVSRMTGQSIAAGRVEVYATLDDLLAERETYQTPLQGGPSTYNFRLEGVTPGIYLLGVCAAAGALEQCEAVSTDGTLPREFDVPPGSTVNIRITL